MSYTSHRDLAFVGSDADSVLLELLEEYPLPICVELAEVLAVGSADHEVSEHRHVVEVAGGRLEYKRAVNRQPEVDCVLVADDQLVAVQTDGLDIAADGLLKRFEGVVYVDDLRGTVNFDFYDFPC